MRGPVWRRRYETSAEEDRALLSRVPPGSRKHKAILVRLCCVALSLPVCVLIGGSTAACICVLRGCSQPYIQLPHCWQSLLAIITDALLLTCQVRLGEKETLESTLKFFDDRIERLSELEFYQVII